MMLRVLLFVTEVILEGVKYLGSIAKGDVTVIDVDIIIKTTIKIAFCILCMGRISKSLLIIQLM